MSVSMNSAMSNYTYSYANKLQPKLDKNDDGKWSHTEVQNYADSYKKATGATLDVDKIMSTYADEDGYISATGQTAIQKDDALGLSKLTETSTSSTKTSSSSSSSSSALNLNDLLDSMSASGKARFSLAIQKSDSMSQMLESFTSTFSNSNGMFDLISQRNVANLYSAQMRYSSSANYQNMSSQLLSVLA